MNCQIRLLGYMDEEESRRLTYNRVFQKFCGNLSSHLSKIDLPLSSLQQEEILGFCLKFHKTIKRVLPFAKANLKQLFIVVAYNTLKKTISSHFFDLDIVLNCFYPQNKTPKKRLVLYQQLFRKKENERCVNDLPDICCFVLKLTHRDNDYVQEESVLRSFLDKVIEFDEEFKMKLGYLKKKSLVVSLAFLGSRTELSAKEFLQQIQSSIQSVNYNAQEIINYRLLQTVSYSSFISMNSKVSGLFIDFIQKQVIDKPIVLSNLLIKRPLETKQILHLLKNNKSAVSSGKMLGHLIKFCYQTKRLLQKRKKELSTSNLINECSTRSVSSM